MDSDSIQIEGGIDFEISEGRMTLYPALSQMAAVQEWLGLAQAQSEVHLLRRVIWQRSAPDGKDHVCQA